MKEGVAEEVEWRKENLIGKEFERAMDAAERGDYCAMLASVELARFWVNQLDRLVELYKKEGVITAGERKRLREELRKFMKDCRRKVWAIIDKKWWTTTTSG